VVFSIVNEAAVADALASVGKADRIGEIMYESYLGQLAHVITKLCADRNAKLALSNSWNGDKIFFELDEKSEGQEISFAASSLRLSCKPSNIGKDLTDLGKDLEALLTFFFEPAYEWVPLKCASNLFQNVEKKNQHLATIATAAGKSGPVEFSIRNLGTVITQLKQKGLENRVGEIFYDSYLLQLAGILTLLCARPESQVALNQSWTGNGIFFEMDVEAPIDQSVTFFGGDLRVSCQPGNIGVNLGSLAAAIGKQLSG